MRISVLASVLGFTLCLQVGAIHRGGTPWTLISAYTQDDNWTVIEYPDGQEVVVELKAASSAVDAKGTARVTRSGSETTINLDVSGMTGDVNTHQVYLVDSLGNATLLGNLIVTDGAGTLSGKTVLSKFMIVVSPEADLTTIVADTKLALRSSVPTGFTVVAREKTVEASTVEPSAASSETPSSGAEITNSTPQYEVPMLNVGSLKRNTDTTLRANFSNGFSGTRASVVVKPQKNGPTQIKMRFTNLKEAPDGTEYLVWEVGPDNSYTLLGHLTQTPKKRESIIDVETALADFGLLITFENAQANTPMGSIVATIVR